MTALAQPQQHETAQYSSAPASNFASLDSLELERLHAQLKYALCNSFRMTPRASVDSVARLCWIVFTLQ